MATSKGPSLSLQSGRESRSHCDRAVIQESNHDARQSPLAIVLCAGHDRADGLVVVLASFGFTSVHRRFDDEARVIVAALKPQLAVLVCNPNEKAGAEMIATIAGEEVGRLLVVSPWRSQEGAMAALALGADAVLTAYDDTRTVRATVDALRRRVTLIAGTIASSAQRERADTQVEVGGLVVDHDTCEIRMHSELVPFTRTEFLIAAQLAAHAGNARSAEELMTGLHEYVYSESQARRSVTDLVRRVRGKLTDCSIQSVEIVSVGARGYRLDVTGEGAGLGAPLLK
jgi:DNA-binding response OmpR family regulator